jgi:predicted ester cyclase
MNDQDALDDLRACFHRLFARHPTIGVDVERAVCHEPVVTAYPTWHHVHGGRRKTLRRGVASCVLRGDKIASRHTFDCEGKAPA